MFGLPWWAFLLLKVGLYFIDLNKVAAWLVKKQEEQRARDALKPPPQPDPADPFTGPE